MNNENLSIIDISVIIPTYNEKDNICLVIDRIAKCLNNITYEILIIDDSSTDGTIETVEKLQGIYPLKLIVRKERGLASAIVEGFKYANGNIYAVMDADLQHPPEKLIDLIEEINNGNDIVIASRYLTNNGFGNFNFRRKIISKVANIPARILFPKLKNINDIQSGFFAIKRRVIDGIILDPIGFKILMEILVMGNYKKLKEIPFEISKREYGNTKLGIVTVIDYIRHLMRLCWRNGELKRFTKYCMVGIVGIIVSTVVLFFFTNIVGIFYIASFVLAHEVSVTSNFIMNDQWTFRECDKSLNFLNRMACYHVAKISGIFVGILLIYIYTEIISVNYLVSNILSTMTGAVWGYFTSVKLVWRN